jgi:hypothetical protein
MQGVGFDRIDFPIGPPAREQFARNSENQPASKRHRNCQDRSKPLQPGQPHTRLKLKENTMQQIDASTHGGNDQAGNRPNQRRQHDQARLARPHERPQSSRYFQLIDHFIDQAGPTSCTVLS